MRATRLPKEGGQPPLAAVAAADADADAAASSRALIPPDEAFWNSLGHARYRPPSLGKLGRRKLLVAVRLGLYSGIASFFLNKPIHTLFGIQRGGIRRAVFRILVSLSFVAVVPCLLVLVAVRARWRRKFQDTGATHTHFDRVLESLGRDLHAWAQQSSFHDLKAFSDKDIGWLTDSAPAAIRRATPDVTADFHRRLRKLRRRPLSLFQTALWLLGFVRRPRLNRRELVSSLGIPQLPGGWDGLTILIVPGLLTKRYPLYFQALRHDLERLGLDYHFSRIDTDASVETNAAVLKAEIELLTGMTRDGSSRGAGSGVDDADSGEDDDDDDDHVMVDGEGLGGGMGEAAGAAGAGAGAGARVGVGPGQVSPERLPSGSPVIRAKSCPALSSVADADEGFSLSGGGGGGGGGDTFHGLGPSAHVSRRRVVIYGHSKVSCRA